MISGICWRQGDWWFLIALPFTEILYSGICMCVSAGVFSSGDLRTVLWGDLLLGHSAACGCFFFLSVNSTQKKQGCPINPDAIFLYSPIITADPKPVGHCRTPYALMCVSVCRYEGLYMCPHLQYLVYFGIHKIVIVNKGCYKGCYNSLFISKFI